MSAVQRDAIRTRRPPMRSVRPTRLQLHMVSAVRVRCGIVLPLLHPHVRLRSRLVLLDRLHAPLPTAVVSLRVWVPPRVRLPQHDASIVS